MSKPQSVILRQIGTTVQLIIDGKAKKMLSMDDGLNQVRDKNLTLDNPNILPAFAREKYDLILSERKGGKNG